MYHALTGYIFTAYCHFLVYALDQFDIANVTLQADKPQLHLLRRVLQKLLRNILVKFVKPAAFQGVQLTEVDYKQNYNIKNDQDVALGSAARDFIKEKNIQPASVAIIVEKAKLFYQTAVDYIIKKLPLNDEFLKHAEVFDIGNLSTSHFRSVEYFHRRFPALQAIFDLNDLQDEFYNLQIEEISPEIVNMERADMQWAAIAELKDCTGGPKFGKIAKFALIIFTIPSSNASCERVFSFVKRVRTDFRESMNTSTLNALCSVKMDMKSRKTACYNQKYDPAAIKAAKSATVQHNTKA